MTPDQLQEEKIWSGRLGRSLAAGSSSAPIANTRMMPICSIELSVLSQLSKSCHFRYVELPIRIYHSFHVSELKRLLSLSCLKCLKMKNRKEYRVLPMNYKAYGDLPVGVEENFQSIVGYWRGVFKRIPYLPFDQCLKTRWLGSEEMPQELGTSWDTNWLSTSVFWQIDFVLEVYSSDRDFCI
ncbi:uncharacterized protein LOC131298003 [Rhododendron vialii]|uniref:uncharacterized protein LOC131298003 n=1 Tax=Rhododendron vialii TaxID=182163 RepID=UPI00265F69C3|nr:uncharacterized protein LOC131298003 [Rhododendron vialii]XP_058179237.1 uncharacterized protein LOC131298003 [Rhododendron vialii]